MRGRRVRHVKVSLPREGGTRVTAVLTMTRGSVSEQATAGSCMKVAVVERRLSEVAALSQCT